MQDPVKMTDFRKKQFFAETLKNAVPSLESVIANMELQHAGFTFANFRERIHKACGSIAVANIGLGDRPVSGSTVVSQPQSNPLTMSEERYRRSLDVAYDRGRREKRAKYRTLQATISK
jgi:hypothetical protein